VFAIKKFFHYVYACHFTLITEPKPFTSILHPEKSLSVLCISRMANYADYLSHFNFDIVFKPTKNNINADYCSSTVNTIHKLTEEEEKEILQCEGFDHFVLQQIKQLPIRAENIACESRKDPHVKKIQILETDQCLTRFGYKVPIFKIFNFTVRNNTSDWRRRQIVKRQYSRHGNISTQKRMQFYRIRCRNHYSNFNRQFSTLHFLQYLT